MFQRFTDRASRVVVLAQEEARMLNDGYIGTEHLLLGLAHEGEGIARQALEALGISLGDVRNLVQEIIGEGQTGPVGHIPFTPRAKKVLELALREALQLGHNYIGTEHLLLGLIREGEGVAARALVKLGADLGRARQQVVHVLSGYAAPAGEVVRGAAAGEAMQRVELRTSEPMEETGPDEWPVCPRRQAPLAEAARYRVLEVPSEDGGETLEVPFGYCSKCGVWLGTVV